MEIELLVDEKYHKHLRYDSEAGLDEKKSLVEALKMKKKLLIFQIELESLKKELEEVKKVREIDRAENLKRMV